jgi:hypothetical protein
MFGLKSSTFVQVNNTHMCTFLIYVYENMECSRMRVCMCVRTCIFEILNVLIVSGNLKLFQNYFTFMSSAPLLPFMTSLTFLA